jgi:hypothetical protein
VRKRERKRERERERERERKRERFANRKRKIRKNENRQTEHLLNCIPYFKIDLDNSENWRKKFSDRYIKTCY